MLHPVLKQLDSHIYSLILELIYIFSAPFCDSWKSWFGSCDVICRIFVWWNAKKWLKLRKTCFDTQLVFFSPSHKWFPESKHLQLYRINNTAKSATTSVHINRCMKGNEEFGKMRLLDAPEHLINDVTWRHRVFGVFQHHSPSFRQPSHSRSDPSRGVLCSLTDVLDGSSLPSGNVHSRPHKPSAANLNGRSPCQWPAIAATSGWPSHGTVSSVWRMFVVPH